jgi:hypothetical protein
MFKWFREYISVLSREFFALYGSAMGILCVSLWLLFRHFNPLSGDGYSEWPILGLYFLAFFIFSRIVLLTSAYFVRKNRGQAKKQEINKKMEVSRKTISNRYRFGSIGFAILFLLVRVLREFGVISVYTNTTLSLLIVFGFMAWMTVTAFKKSPDTKLKSGSLAEKVRVSSKYILLASMIVFVVLQIWISIILRKFP